ncbi:hypothetical protein QAD02_008412 [Eretmocerus hayati]|uniref:Uncharacterized protein n=1 Tax=Eretmocerus hayati TaxID=131215 RepID=A0ACC2NAS9_9HYME|nr:hypothetical protein QAD02_008412 [Eretmocerus hayati]
MVVLECEGLTAAGLMNYLDNGLATDAKDEFGDEPNDPGQSLREAIKKGESDILKVLLQHGAELQNVDNLDGLIVDSLMKDDTDLVKTMLEHNLDPNISLESHDRCILNYAIKNDKEDLIELCLDLNSDVNIPNYLGHTAIFLAVEEGNKSLMGRLVSNGAKLDIWDNAGFYLLTWAIIYEREEITMELLHLGIDITKHDIPNLRGNAPQAALSMNRLKIVDALITRGIDLCAMNVKNENILDECLACMRSKIYPPATCDHIFNMLVLRGAKVSDMRYYPFLPEGFFMYATESMINLLCELGLQIRGQSEVAEALTPLHEAYYNPDPNVLEILVKKYQIDINMRDHLGNSVIYIAANEYNVVKLHQLFKLGANLHHRNNVNQPALLYAVNRNRLETACEWLKKRSDLNSILFVPSYVVEGKLIDYQTSIVKSLTLEYATGRLQEIEDRFIHEFPSYLPIYEVHAAELREMRIYSINGVSLLQMLKVTSKSTLGSDEFIVGIIEQVNLGDIFPLYWADIVKKISRCADHQKLVEDASLKLCGLSSFDKDNHKYVLDTICGYLSRFDLLKLSEV